MYADLPFFLPEYYLREGVGCIGSSSGERGEERGSTCCFNCIDHALLGLP